MDPLHRSKPSYQPRQRFVKDNKPELLPLHFYEVWEDGSRTLQMRTGILPYAKVDDWLHLKGEYHVVIGDKEVEEQSLILRLVACDLDQHPFAIGCGYPTFQSIQQVFNLHETSEEAIINNNGAFARYFTRNRDSPEVESLALIMKVANCVNIGYDAISITHNLKRRTTRAFMHGVIDDEIQRLIHYLQAHNEKALFEDPLLLPAQVLQGHRVKTEAHRVMVDDHLHRTEIQLGYAIPGVLDDKPLQYYREEILRSETVEFEKITRRLHSCSTELGAITHAGNCGKELGKFLLQTAQELEKKRCKPASKDSVYHKEHLVQSIEFQINLYSLLGSQVPILKERVINHINLCFSLIAQDENRISRSVAEESAMIAVATKRDSAAMKSIALLTIVFLPPTFVATFFSMTMFDWKPDSDQSDSSIASTYVWVYWAVAVPLTATVLIVWRVWMTMEDKTYDEDLRKAKLERKLESAPRFHYQKDDFTAVDELMAEYSEYQQLQVRRNGRVPPPFRVAEKRVDASLNKITSPEIRGKAVAQSSLFTAARRGLRQHGDCESV